MKTPPARADRLLGLAWTTPAGPMEGLLSDQGCMGLNLPFPESQFPEASNDVQWISATWLTGSDYWRPSSAMLDEAEKLTRYLADFYSGRKPSVEPRIGLVPRSPFEADVWKAAREVPFGETTTYVEIARRIGKPGAARAVGQVMRRNPLVLLMPCHRVLATGNGASRLGGFTGGLRMKSYLLRLEGHKEHGSESFFN